LTDGLKPTIPPPALGFLDHVKSPARRVLSALVPGAPRWLTLPLVAACVILAIWQLRSLDVPILGDHNWRQSDTYSVAYNFLHESANFFHPRIDWSHGRSGIMGMEAPILPYLISGAMTVFGDHASVGRWVVWLLFALSLYFFGRYLIPKGNRGVVLGLLVMTAFSPMALSEFRQIQPDGPMVALMVMAAASFHQFGRTDRRKWLVAGLALYSVAVLIKSPAIVAGPAMWLFMLTPKRVTIRIAVIRAAWLLVPIAAWLAWNAWAKHLNNTFNDGEVYFAIEFNLKEMLKDLTNGGQIRHVFGYILPVYMTNWVLFPAVLAGLVLGFEKDNRPIAIPMLAWLLGAALFLGMFSSRLGAHWYYALVALPPVLYFGALSIGRLLTLAARPMFESRLQPPPLPEDATPLQTRWVAFFLLPTLALAPLIGGRLRALMEAPAAAGNGPSGTWLTESGLLGLLLIQTLAVAAVLVPRAQASQRARSFARFFPLALLVVGVVGLSRAHHDAREVFRFRTLEPQWATIEARLAAIRSEVDRFSTREDLFVVDVGNPWYLHVPLRKGWAEHTHEIDELGLGHYTSRGARFLIHYRNEARKPREIFRMRPLTSIDGAEVYCIAEDGCPVLQLPR